MTLEVRHATAEDADAVLAGYEWLFEPPGRVPHGYDAAAARSRLLEAIGDPHSTVLVAVDGDLVVGLATVYLTYDSVRFGQRAWVEDLAVDPGRRSKGIGAQLLDAARSWAGEAGAAILGLESHEARAEAHRFYERQDPVWRSNAYGWSLK